MSREEWREAFEPAKRAVTGIPLPARPRALRPVAVPDGGEGLKEVAGEEGSASGDGEWRADTGVNCAGGERESLLQGLLAEPEPLVSRVKQFSTLPATLVNRLEDIEVRLFYATDRRISRTRVSVEALRRLLAEPDPVEAAAAWPGWGSGDTTRDHSFRLPRPLQVELRRAALALTRRDPRRSVSHLIGRALDGYLAALASELPEALGEMRPDRS